MKNGVSGTPAGSNSWIMAQRNAAVHNRLQRNYEMTHPGDLRDKYSTTARIREFEQSTGVNWEQFVTASYQAKAYSKMMQQEADMSSIQGIFGGLKSMVGSAGTFKNLFSKKGS